MQAQTKGDNRRHHQAPLGLRSVAAFEFAKGLAILSAGVGLLALLHTDKQAVAEEIVRGLRIDPAWRYAQLFIEESSKLTDTRIWLGLWFAVVYAIIRFAEAYGLWHERHWAEWFAVISAGLYVPFEIYHLFLHPTLLKAVVFLFNVAIIIYLARILAMNRRIKKAAMLPRNEA